MKKILKIFFAVRIFFSKFDVEKMDFPRKKGNFFGGAKYFGVFGKNAFFDN